MYCETCCSLILWLNVLEVLHNYTINFGRECKITQYLNISIYGNPCCASPSDVFHKPQCDVIRVTSLSGWHLGYVHIKEGRKAQCIVLRLIYFAWIFLRFHLYTFLMFHCISHFCDLYMIVCLWGKRGSQKRIDPLGNAFVSIFHCHQ